MPAPNHDPQPGTDPFTYAIIGLALLIATLYAGATVAAFITGDGDLDTKWSEGFTALFNLPRTMGNPAHAWPEPARSQLPGPWLYWSATIGTLLTLTAALLYGWTLLRGLGGDTLARRKRLGVHTQARYARSRDLRSLYLRGEEPGRFPIAQRGMRTLATEAPYQPGRRTQRGDRGSVLVTGPSRSGKTRNTIAGITRYRGPAVLVSIKNDLLADTIDHRRQLGQVKVFDPTGTTALPSARWTPLRDAKTIDGAQAAAGALIGAAPKGARAEDDHWLQQAEILLSALLWIAANVKGKTMADIVNWSMVEDKPTPERAGTLPPIIRALADGEDEAVATAARQIQPWITGIWQMAPETSGSIYATARSAVWPWASPRLAETANGNDIDLDWLLAGENTLYVSLPLGDAHRYAPAVGGLINDLLNQAFTHNHRTGRPLDPGLLLVIDEAANVPLRRLPEWASTVAGIGVQLVTVWQSIAQIHALYGRQAETILTNHVTKLFFGGMSDLDGLDYVGRLLGEEHVPGTLRPSASWNLTENPSRIALAQPNVLRQLRRGEALLIHGNLPAAHVRALATGSARRQHTGRATRRWA